MSETPRATASPPPADALREALERLDPRYRITYLSEDGESFGVVSRQEFAEALAASPAPGLDVERLARALENHINRRLSTHAGGGWCDMPECAPDIAAEYARLAAQEGGE